MTVPAIPANFYIQQGDGVVLLSWDITAGATSYSIERSTDGVSFSVLNTSVVNYYSDSTVTINTKYYYKIASVGSGGTGSYSSAQSVIPTLPGYLSLGELRQRSQQAADREGSQFLTTPEWNFNINQSAKEYYDLLITAYEDYFVAPRVTFTTDGSSSLYALPNGQNFSSAPALYKLYGVDCGLDTTNNAFVTLKKFNFIDRNKYVFQNVNGNILGIYNMEYRLVGNYIDFIPIPAANQTIGLWYFPILPAMLRDTDVLQGFNGWTEYAIIDAAIKALRKEESDVSVLMAQKMEMKKRIEEAAQNRDAGQPDSISDLRRAQMWNQGGADGNGWY